MAASNGFRLLHAGGPRLNHGTGLDSAAHIALLDSGHAASRTRFRRGTLAALGSFKFYLTIPILVLFLLWKKWRFAAGFSVAALSVAALSVWLTGIAQTKIYLYSIFSMRSGLLGSAGQFFRLPVRLMPNLHGLVSGLSGGTSRCQRQFSP